MNGRKHICNLLKMYVKTSQTSKRIPSHSFLNLSPRSAMGIFKPVVYEEGILAINNGGVLNNTNCALTKYKKQTNSVLGMF